MQETIKITVGDKIISLKVEGFDTDVEVDDLLRIDYSNIMGEILTFPVLLNRIGLLKADQEEVAAKAKLEVDILGARLSEQYRKKLTRIENEKMKSPTVAEVENAVLLDEGFQLKKKSLFRKQRDLQYIDSLYWSAKSKDDKLNKMGGSLKPEDHTNMLLEGSINGVLIKVREPLIK